MVHLLIHTSHLLYSTPGRFCRGSRSIEQETSLAVRKGNRIVVSTEVEDGDATRVWLLRALWW
jgi:hypothetical protein